MGAFVYMLQCSDGSFTAEARGPMICRSASRNTRQVPIGVILTRAAHSDWYGQNIFNKSPTQSLSSEKSKDGVARRKEP